MNSSTCSGCKYNVNELLGKGFVIFTPEQNAVVSCDFEYWSGLISCWYLLLKELGSGLIASR